MELESDRLSQILSLSENVFSDCLDYFNTIRIPIIEAKLKKDSSVYRARVTSKNALLNNLSEYSMPPVSKSYSRVGSPNEEWFYCSETFETSIIETLPRENEDHGQPNIHYVHIGEWVVKDALNVLVIPDFDLKNEILQAINLDLYFDNNDKVVWGKINPHFIAPTTEDLKTYQLTAAFVHSMLLRDQSKQGSKIEGIVYPSVQYNLKSNIAIKGDSLSNGSLLLKSAMSMVFKNEALTLGKKKPHYSGPIEEPVYGVYDSIKDKINWQKDEN